jgi:hypothetical protein
MIYKGCKIIPVSSLPAEALQRLADSLLNPELGKNIGKTSKKTYSLNEF